SRDLRTAAWVLVFCGLAVAGWTGCRLRDDATSPLVPLTARGAAVELRVEVAKPPKPVSTPGFAGRPGGVRSVLIQADALQLVRAGTPVSVSGSVLLIAPAHGWTGLLRGQQLNAWGALTEPSIQDGTVAVLRVRGSPRQVTAAPVWERAAESLRAGLRGAAAGLPDDERALLPAVVVGDDSGLRPTVLSDFRTSGMAYLLAVGGFHFMIVCGGLLWLLRKLTIGPRTRAVVTGLMLAAFLEVAGPKPSVLRAAFMVGVGLLALGSGRPRSAVPALATSEIVLLLWHPEFGADIGFALSVAATTAMVLLARPTAAALRRRGVPPGIAELLAIAVVAHLATAPFVAAAYGQFSVAAVGANLLAEPAFVPTMLLGALVIAIAPLSGWLAALIAHLTQPTTWWLLAVARRAARLPSASLAWPTGVLGGVALAAVILAVVVLLRFRRIRVLLAAALAGVFVVLIPVRVLAPGWPPAGWAMVDCDVGQGDGEVLATADPGRAVVVDSGPDEDAIDECLSRLDVSRVPLVVLSHLHADHVGGLAAVLRDRSVGAVAVGPSRVPAWAWVKVRAESAAAGVPVVQLNPGERLSWPGLTIEVIGPPAAESWPGGDDPSGTVVNNSSLVLRATTTAGRVLLTGDVELQAQADLLNARLDLTADILKIPHHGSRYSSPSFLDAVHARVAVASVGAGNPYGHPSPLTLGRLSADGALVLRTDQDGDVAVLPGPNGPEVVRRGDPRPGPRAPPAARR
ncbi:MAG TPA: ComEC/Rec2 family competence protein, partial [Pseudonocardiaceae bacterium]|nr:ComEC/Rec2 family competence protein [Pseudonocardiaceae bacterium]